MQDLGMIAGVGAFPILIARQAHREGWPLPTVALSAQVATGLEPYCRTLVQCGPGQVAKILRVLRQHQVRQVVIVGKVQKQFLFERPRFDWRALRVLSRARDYRDRAIFRAIGDEFAREGIEVIEQTQLLGHLLMPAGVLTRRQPTSREWDDMAYGFAQAKAVVALDIGQTLVVRNRTVLSVEAAEGTDTAIRRGCELGRPGAVVIKVGRPEQDTRFDTPTVGLDTLKALIAGRASVLAVEAGSTFILDRAELVDLANSHRMALVGVTSESLAQHGQRKGL